MSKKVECSALFFSASEVFALVHDDTDTLLREFYALVEKLRNLPSPSRNPLLDITQRDGLVGYDFDALVSGNTVSRFSDFHNL